MSSDPIGHGIDRQAWLAPAESALRAVANVLFKPAGKSARDLLHGTWLGHPLHPAVVAVPIGAWTVAAVLDAVELAGGPEEYGPGADAAIRIGLGGAIPSALSGLNDWQYTHRPAKRVGALHGALNGTALGCYLVSLALRRRGRRDEGIGFSLAGFGFVMAAAYFGGHLSYNEKVGVDRGEHGGPREWTRALDEPELREGQMRKARVEGVDILIARQSGRLFAVHNTCPHMGGPLAEGELQGRSVICPWHGSRFCLETGAVLEGPAVYGVGCFEVRTREGQIEVRLAQPKN